MAVYAYECQACKEQFEVNAPMSERERLDREPPACPKCGKAEVKKLVSTFTSKPASTW
ncbi:MAG: zinc ribbon domain-containing protein [Chloroflexota bacterium]|nr:zinc ribbon domain-containing protein [Chloroflexota bacterium]